MHVSEEEEDDDGDEEAWAPTSLYSKARVNGT